MELYLDCIDTVSYKILEEMIKNGNLKNYGELVKIINETRKILIEKKDYNIYDILNSVITDFSQKTSEIVDKDYAPGIATSIKVANGPQIDIFKGKITSEKNARIIDKDVRFDLASITKLFTAIQILKESELGNIDLNKSISEINSAFKQDVSVIEALTYCHNFRTDGRIDECTSKKEALQKLRNAIVVESNIHMYSDIPYMIVNELLPNKEENFHKYFNEILGLTNTSYDTKNSITTGGEASNLSVVHDQKARIIANAGHAGIFSTGCDLMKLLDGLYNEKLISRASIKKLSTPFYNGDYIKNSDGTMRLVSTGSNEKYKKSPMWITRGMMYKKHPRGLDVTEVLPCQSVNAFASSGFTGTWVNYDIDNGFGASILTNPISGNGKIKGYVWALDDLKTEAINACIKINIIKKVFETYYEKSNELSKKYNFCK